MSTAKRAKKAEQIGSSEDTKGELKARAVRCYRETLERLNDYADIRGIDNLDEALNHLMDMDPITESDVIKRYKSTIGRGRLAKRRK